MNEIFYVHRNYLKNINFTLFNGKTVSRTECLPASDKTLIVVCFFPQSINIPLITATPYSLSLPTATAVTCTASLPLDARRYKLSVVEAVYIIRREVNYWCCLSYWLQILQLLIYAKYKRRLWCYVANRTLVRATKTAVIRAYSYLPLGPKLYIWRCFNTFRNNCFYVCFPKISTVQKLYMYKHYDGQSTKLEVRNY